MYLEDVYDEELGAPLRKKIKRVAKKVAKGALAVSTGGLSLAVKPGIKLGKRAAKTKIGRAIGAVATGGASLAFGGKKKPKALVKRLSAVSSPAAKPVAKAIIRRVKSKKAGECRDNDELIKLVAGKLIAELGPPLDKANQMLAKYDLQRQATYEHKKLMSDADFRRKVLAFISRKAKNGNRSCQRTICALRL